MSSDAATHVLIVDDSDVNCTMLRRRLERRGFRATTALSGPEALSALDVHDDIDLVLLDVAMPDMSGIEVLEVIRQTHAIDELPVIMVTAHRDTEFVLQALSRGANDFLTKPIDLAVLLARMGTQLSIRERRPQTQSGEFGLKGRRTKIVTARTFCARCTRCQEDESAGECAECGSPPPIGGWPAIAESPYPRLGTTIAGHYFVERFVGAGAAGSVYRARDVNLNRRYAIKIVDLGSEPTATRRRIEAEVDAMVALTNPHVVRIYEVATVSENVFGLVMDFVTGHTLGTLLEQMGHLEPSLALEVLRQAAQGLHEAHQHDLIHRDVKPENMMLEKLPAGGYHVKILDFGIVAELGRNKTDGRGLLGTPLYMSPEHYDEDRTIDHRADIYSLGGVLFHMLTGHPPYSGINLVALLNKHLNHPVPSVGDVVEPDLRAKLDGLIGRMLAKRAEERFDSLFDVIREIEAILPETGDPRRKHEARDDQEPDGRRRLSLTEIAGVTPIADPAAWQPGPVAFSGALDVVSAEVRDHRCALRYGNLGTGEARTRAVELAGATPLVGISTKGDVAIVGIAESGRAVTIATATGRVVRRFAFPSRELTCVAIAANGRVAAAGTRDGRVFVADSEDGASEVARASAQVTCLAITQRSGELAVGRADCTLSVTPIEPRGLRSQLPPLPFVPSAVAFNGVGDTGAVLGANQHISLFLPLGGTIINQVDLELEAVVALAFDRANRLLALGHEGGELRAWDVHRLFDGVGRTSIVQMRSRR